MKEKDVEKLSDTEVLAQRLDDDTAQRQLEEFAVRLTDYKKEYQEKLKLPVRRSPKVMILLRVSSRL